MVDVSAKRVLVIGNIEDSVGFIESYCSKKGMECNSIEEGELGEISQGPGYDLYILGLDLTNTEGIYTIEKLAQQEVNNPVILLSSDAGKLTNSAVHFAEREGLTISGVIAPSITEERLSDLFQQALEPQLDETSNIVNEKLACCDLQKEILDGNFSFLYQPQLNLVTKDIVGVECLSRLHTSELGSVSPMEFIPELERKNLITDFTLFMVKASLSELKNICRKKPDLKVAFNISPLSLNNDFFSQVCEIISKSDIEFRNIVLELQEPEAFNLDDGFEKVLMKLKLVGISLSIDGFGSKLVKTKYLNDLPFNELKIDNNYVQEIGQNGSIEAIIRSISDLAENLSYRFVCKGVETKLQMDFLLDQNCVIQQGFLFSKPLTYYELRSFIYDVGHQIEALESGAEPEGVAGKINAAKGEIAWVTRDAGKLGRLYKSMDDNLNNFKLYQLNELSDADYQSLGNAIVVVVDDTVKFPDIFKIFESFPGISILVLYEKSDHHSPKKLFDLGVNEIVEKHVMPLELMHRIFRVIEFKTQITQLDSATKNTNEIAMEAMKQAAHYGNVLEFFKSAISINSVEELLEASIKFFESMGYQVVISFFDNDYMYIRMSAHDGCSELVRRVVNLLRTKGRVHEYDKRLVLNGDSTTIVILNSPEDEFELGRIKDVGAALVDLLGERWCALLEQKALSKISDQISSVLSTAIVDLQEKTDLVLQSFSRQISESFHLLDLSEEQEEYLIRLAKNAITNFSCNDEISALADQMSVIRNVANQRIKRV